VFHDSLHLGGSVGQPDEDSQLDSTIKSSVSFWEDKIEAAPDNASDDPSSSLDYHDLMVTLLVSCELDVDVLLDP
jgi:hypothetical protein